MSQSQHELWRYQPPYGTMIDLQVYAKWPEKIKRAYWGLPPEDEVREESAAVLNFREKVRKAGPLDEVQIPVWMSVSDGVRIIKEERERMQRRAERDEQLLVMAGVKQPDINAEGRKDDTGKLPYDLIAPEFLAGTAEILAFGAAKYAPRNWEKGMAWSRPFSALMRHMWAWWAGEKLDPETGKSHLWHACCCLMFLVAYEQRSTGTDDRPNSA